ncbi:homocysteine S-methyltransferase family protein [Rhodococcus aerolatus]
MPAYDDLLARAAAGRTVLIDGATGTECERRGVPVLPGAWSGGGVLTHPDTVRAVHADYVALGAELLIADTFATHRHVLDAAGVGEQFEAVNRRAVELAIEARDAAGAEHVVVAAGISSWTFLTTQLPREPTLDEVRRNTADQVAVLAAAGAELVILEMMVDVDRMLATLDGAQTAGLPVWVGLSCGDYGQRTFPDRVPRLKHGQPMSEAISALDGRGVDALAVMHTDVALVDACLDVALAEWSGPVAVYAHSGDFRAGHWVFDDVISPADYAAHAAGWVRRGVTIVGGCCGIGPEHVRELAALVTSEG